MRRCCVGAERKRHFSHALADLRLLLVALLASHYWISPWNSSAERSKALLCSSHQPLERRWWWERSLLRSCPDLSCIHWTSCLFILHPVVSCEMPSTMMIYTSYFVFLLFRPLVLKTYLLTRNCSNNLFRFLF